VPTFERHGLCESPASVRSGAEIFLSMSAQPKPRRIANRQRMTNQNCGPRAQANDRPQRLRRLRAASSRQKKFVKLKTHRNPANRTRAPAMNACKPNGPIRSLERVACGITHPVNVRTVQRFKKDARRILPLAQAKSDLGVSSVLSAADYFSRYRLVKQCSRMQEAKPLPVGQSH
jgi:hypothetical protein